MARWLGISAIAVVFASLAAWFALEKSMTSLLVLVFSGILLILSLVARLSVRHFSAKKPSAPEPMLLSVCRRLF